MSRNRKSQSAATRFGPALKAFVLCLLLGGSGVGYVWQKEQIMRLFQQIKVRENRLEYLQRENDKLRKGLQTMCNASYLDKRIQDFHLGLGPPQANQVLSLAEPTCDPPLPEPRPQYVTKSN